MFSACSTQPTTKCTCTIAINYQQQKPYPGKNNSGVQYYMAYYPKTDFHIPPWVLVEQKTRSIYWTEDDDNHWKRKYRHFDEIFVSGCTGSRRFKCSQWWKFPSKWRHFHFSDIPQFAPLIQYQYIILVFLKCTVCSSFLPSWLRKIWACPYSPTQWESSDRDEHWFGILGNVLFPTPHQATTSAKANLFSILWNEIWTNIQTNSLIKIH